MVEDVRGYTCSPELCRQGPTEFAAPVGTGLSSVKPLSTARMSCMSWMHLPALVMPFPHADRDS
jgi:hypothetical protein